MHLPEARNWVSGQRNHREDAIRTVTLLLVGAVLAPTGLRGQDRGDAPQRSVSIVLGMGAALNGPAAGLADQLREAGYDEPIPCAFVCPDSHPSKDRPERASARTVRVVVSRQLLVGGGFGSTTLGGSTGFKRDGLGFIFSHWEASTLWAGAFWRVGPGRLGGGPALYRLGSDDDVNQKKHEISKLGLMGEAGFEYPSNRRFFIDMAVRLHVVPSEDVRYTRPYSESVVKIRPNWTHVNVLAGIGVRL